MIVVGPTIIFGVMIVVWVKRKIGVIPFARLIFPVHRNLGLGPYKIGSCHFIVSFFHRAHLVVHVIKLALKGGEDVRIYSQSGLT